MSVSDELNDAINPDVDVLDEDSFILINSRIPAWKFVFVIYFCVCGGAYGFEDAIKYGYPAYTLSMLIVVPLFWAIPIALVTAELGTALPSNEGAFKWIKTAFGQEISFVLSIVYWFSYSVDTSLYPSIFYTYFKEFDDSLFSQTAFLILITFGATLFIVILNLLGIEILGTLSMILLFIQLTPIFIIFGWSLFSGRISFHDWIKMPPGDQLSRENIHRLALCMQVMIWSYSGYDSVGCIVEQLEESKKNLKKCLFGACSMATLTYFIVIVGSIGIQKHYDQWEEGYLSNMGESLAGPWLKYFIIFSAMIASLGTFNALLFPTSQQLKSLGSPSYLNLPILSWTHPRFHTPWVAIGINGIVCGLAGTLPFLFLLQLNNILYAVLIIFICFSAVKLRYSEEGKSLPRPFKVAESNGMVILAVFWPIVICIYLITDAILGDWRLGVVALALGFFLLLLHFGCSFRNRGLWKEGKKETLQSPDEGETFLKEKEMAHVVEG